MTQGKIKKTFLCFNILLVDRKVNVKLKVLQKIIKLSNITVTFVSFTFAFAVNLKRKNVIYIFVAFGNISQNRMH